MKVKFKFTLLNVAAILFLVVLIVYTAVNYSTLSEAEGWGVVGMVGLAIYTLTAFVVDLIIRRLIKNTIYQNIVGAIVLLVYLTLLFRSIPH